MGGKGGAEGNGNVQPLPGFSSFSPEHGHLLLPPLGARARLRPDRCCRVRGAGPVRAAGDAPFPDRSPLPDGGCGTVAAGPRCPSAGPSAPRPRGLSLAPDRSSASGSHDFPAAQAPAAHRDVRPPGCALCSELLGLTRTAPGAAQDARGGARAGLEWAPAWGCRTWEAGPDLPLPPPPPFSLPLGRLPAPRRPASPTPKPEDDAPAAAAARRSHDRPVPFGCARPPQVPPGRVATLTVGRAGSCALAEGAPGPAFSDRTPTTLLGPPLPATRSVYPGDTWRQEVRATFPSSAPSGGHPFPFVWSCLRCSPQGWPSPGPK